MAVFVYSTASVLKPANTTTNVQLSINNRNPDPQTYRFIVWDTTTGVKTVIFDSGVGSVNSNNTVVFLNGFAPGEQTMLNAATSFEVEIRLSNQHMAPYVELHYNPILGPAITLPVFADEMFRDKDLNSNP
ncbi:hypothetical protein [Paenibacillus thalictri]|uniref:Uncharacterized protein n=1 Tax=Paenibacillus thalictri TaxID=2527873 RepID=A0A4Q9DZ41_9BACL|nr:hypothetical protein [Paenibacillus thalictri]TBL81745.1 hypothetical protein EYB31_01760 [Paenibacillus thalictri]